MLNIWTLLPQWAKHALYVVVIAGISASAGYFGRPARSVEVIQTGYTAEQVQTKISEAVSSAREEWNRDFKQTTKKRVIRKPDGTVIEDSKTVVDQKDNGKKEDTKTSKDQQTDKKTETKIEYITKIVDRHPSFSVGVSVDPVAAVKKEWVVGADLGVRVVGGVWVFAEMASSVASFEPRYTLGIRVTF